MWIVFRRLTWTKLREKNFQNPHAILTFVYDFLGILFIFHMLGIFLSRMVFLVVKCFCVFSVIKELLQGSMHVEN